MEKITEPQHHEEAYTTYEPLDELIGRHHPDNPKDHDIGSLIESIQEFGFVRNVMINETDNLLLYGHGTTEALWQMYESGEYQVPNRIKVNDDGMWLVPTDRGIKLSKKRAKAYVIADNRHSELGGWTEPQLVDNLIALAGKNGKGLIGTGFDGDELDNLIRMYRPELIEEKEDPGAQLDKAAELQEKWQVERGQIWEIGRHRLMCGDSTSEEDVGRLMGGKKAGAILTDPLYGTASQSKVQLSGRGFKEFNIDWDVIVEWKWIDAIERIAEEGAAIVCFFENAGITVLWNELEARGFHPLHNVYWRKTTIPQPRQNFCSNVESSVFARKPNGVLCWNGGGATPNIFESNRAQGNERVSHETQKPLSLIEWLIKLITNIDFIIVDPFLGSGTTMVAAEQLNRICYGIEIEPKYCSVTLERMSGMGLQPKLIK